MATTALPQLGTPHTGTAVKAQRLGVSLPVLIVGLVILFSFLLVPHTVSDPDIWWHLQNAKLQLASHSFLRHDSYSWTAANSPWMNHEWLAELPYYLGYRALGTLGVYLVTVAAVTTIMLGILALAWRRSGSPKAAVVAVLPAILLSSVSFGPRTLLFGWMLLLVELFILDAASSTSARTERTRVLWLLPPLFAVWVNTHGSWMIGLVLFALYAGGGLFNLDHAGMFAARWSAPQRRTLYQVGTASIAALFCNPYGWRLVFYPFDMAFRQKLNIASVEEWRSVDFHLLRGKVFLAMIALLILFRILGRVRWSLQDAAFAFVALYSGLTYSRFMFLAAILVTPLLARDLAQWMPWHPGRDKRFFNAVALGVAAWLMLSHLPTSQQVDQQLLYPVAAVQYLNAHPVQGRTFNEYLWGGYMAFHAPAVKTYIDSRMDIFEYNGTLKTYLDIVHIEDSLALMDRDHVQNVFIPLHSPLAYLLTHTAGWRTVYKDDVAILLTRQ